MNAIIHQDVKEGVVALMKNLFLYLRYNDENASSNKLDNIYFFNNSKIVALDRNVYGCKYRLELQSRLGVEPYYITGNIFKEFLLYSAKNKNHILLRNIEFSDDSIVETEEYKALKEALWNQTEDIYYNIKNVLDEFDTSIRKITFRYNGYDFTISEDGVLDADAPEQILKLFIEDKMINKLILGMS